jgi:hypothetical protein
MAELVMSSPNHYIPKVIVATFAEGAMEGASKF